ncbi:hypothetical protein ACFQJ7_03805 [Halovenus rubra]|uniref:DUF7310 domain-containing protein n=2 Tax=Halovenus rubra TaxID=869890 RepID=A0ABD5X6G5_9EURY|nr:hypothetical protein [Halovenus rubra]
MDDALTERVEAVERAVTDGEYDLSGLADEGEIRDRVSQLEEQQNELKEQVAELKAATQALRGYVGNIRAVNEEVENRAETALAKVESLESTVAPDDETETNTHKGNSGWLADGSEQNGSRHARRQPADIEETHPTDQHNAGNRHSRPESRSHAPHTDSGNQRRPEAGNGQTDTKRSEQIETNHCHVCGRGEPTSDHGTAESSIDKSETEGHKTGNEPFENTTTRQLNEEDPLVSEETNADEGTLSRFRQLL